MTASDLLERPERRIDGDAKTTGRATYAADLAVPGALHAAFVRSPFPHARIVSVDASRARALAGVRAVLTGADVKGQRLGRRLQDWPVLCWDRVLFVGDRVAAVAADDREIAEEAVRLIAVEYEELPALLDLDTALRPDAHVDRATDAVAVGHEVTRARDAARGLREIHERGPHRGARGIQGDVMVELHATSRSARAVHTPAIARL